VINGEKSLSVKINKVLRIWDYALVILFLAGLIGAFLYRAAYIDRIFGFEVTCNGCFTYSLFVHDIIYLSVLFLVFLSSFYLRKFIFYIPLRIIALFGLVIYISDVVTMEQFFTRLKIGDVKIYGEQASLIWRHVTNTGFISNSVLVLAFLVAILVLIVSLPPRPVKHFRSAFLVVLFPVAGIASGVILQPISYVHDWALENIVKANLAPGVAQDYSPEKISQVIEEYEKSEKWCKSGQNRKQNIVLLILESWSPYQSKYWSGINDWTPKLDQLARDNTAITQMHAGGFATNEGLISLLAGLEYIAPTKPFFKLKPFETAWGVNNTIPEVLNDSGYHTAFLTSGNLKFANKGKWLKETGFEYIEGHDHPEYKGHKRLHFDAVADDVLYWRVANYIAEKQNEDKPFFVAIENVSTHHPYIHPHSREMGEEAVFRYMDDTVDNLYQQLVSQNFFDNGMLIIVSDHRAMLPLSSEERELFGRDASSRIPAILINSPISVAEIDLLSHQNDLLPTLMNYSREQVCDIGPYRNLFDPENSDKRCVFHARGDERDHLDVFCPQGSGTIVLNGDDTHFLTIDGLSEQDSEVLLDEVNRYRIIADLRQQLFEKNKK